MTVAFSNFSGVAWWFLLHFIILILYVIFVCRLEHGAALMSSIVSTLKYCLLWHSRFCPSCLRCQPVLHDLCLKDERSTWSGRVASLSPWTLVKYDFYYMYSTTFICPAPVTGVHGFLSYSQIWLNLRFTAMRLSVRFEPYPAFTFAALLIELEQHSHDYYCH